MKTLEAREIAVVRGGRRILDDASLRLDAGDFHAVAGSNGSGKSTLLRALAGIWPVVSGSVVLDGESIASFSRRHAARRIAFVPQDGRMDWPFTVEEIVTMGRYPHRGRFAHETETGRRAIDLAMEHCDVAALRARLVSTLSGGERQRVLIARSLAAEPQFLLLDEPAANLDVEHAVGTLELCRSLAGAGRAVVMATHDLNAAARYASHVTLMSHGRIIHSGAREVVLTPLSVRRIFGLYPEIVTTRNGYPIYVFHGKES
jgi:iron complex transport system ATP-binding protein